MGGKPVPLIFNKAQMRIHNTIEEIRSKNEPVRLVICKGRQQGCSTYVTARFLHRAILNQGVSVFILAHISDSTNYLFEMVKRMFNNLPDPLKPAIERSNRKELKFGKLDSEYALGTAGSEDIGRSMNPTLLHMSEAAFYTHTDEISTGLMQGVALAPGTEIIMESTANGRTGMFYNTAMRGIGEIGYGRFKTLFLPWYLQDEYSLPAPFDFKPTPEEEEWMERYGLHINQVYWYRTKLEEFNGDVWKLKQEYPLTLQDAFVSSGENLFKGEWIEEARKRNINPDTLAPKIMGVDGADSRDKTVIVIRQGRKVLYWKQYDEMKPMRLAGIVAQLIDREGIDMVFLDVAYGYGARDRLKELGYGSVTQTVHFGEKSIEPGIYKNIRAQMYGYMKEWFEEGGVDIPDDEAFVRDFYVIPDFKQTGGRGLLQLPSKEEIKDENDGRSPDVADALALTFARPVRSNARRINVLRGGIDVEGRRSPFKTVRRMQNLSRTIGGEKRSSELYVR